MRSLFKILPFTFATFLLSITTVIAQSSGGPGSGNPSSGGPGSGSSRSAASFENPLAFNTLSDFLEAILDVIITIGFPIVILAVVYVGFLFVRAQGSDTKLAEAKTAFLWVLIGALLVLGAQVLSVAIQGTVDDLTWNTPVQTLTGLL